MADECSVRVVCRYRPHNKIEEAQGGQQVCSFPSDGSVNQNGRVYQFDRVFNTSTTQTGLYCEAARPIVQDVLKGCNGTMFAYGQTSSGKTHTMEGVLGSEELCGVIPRIVEDIFNHIQHMDPGDEMVENFFIKVSYFEIYMEKIRDLLNTSKTNLSIHEDKNRSPYVKDLTERYVASPQEVFEIIEEGKSNRHVAATNMNLHSSRSHSILSISVRQSFGGDKRTLNGKLYLVDLAGSENVGKTGASGMTFEEAKMINKSLSALGNVISALTEGKGRTHVPYRDSKLTRILQESLGGNAKTTMVICCSPSSFNDSETKSTLDFGKRAKSIKNVVVVNEELTAEEWKRRYEKEREKNQKMKNVLSALQKEVQRWRAGESVPVSEQASMRTITSTSTAATTASSTPSNSSGGGGSASAASSATSMLSSSVAADDTLSSSIVSSSTGLPIAGGSGGQASSVAMAAAVTSPASLSSVERQQFEEERAKLYSDLDEKDGEINTLGQEVEKLKMVNIDLQELLDIASRESSDRLTNLNRFQQECEQNAEQVKEVLKALEDMALNYESKNQELDEKKLELEQLKEQNDTVQVNLQEVQISLKSMKDEQNTTQNQLQLTLNAWYDSLTAKAPDLSCDHGNYQRPIAERLDESLTSLNLFDNQLRSGVSNLVHRSRELENTLRKTENELASRIEDISTWKLRVSQYEADAECYERNIIELQASNQSLKAALDSLNREMATVTANANAQAARGSDAKKNGETKAEVQKHTQLLEQQHAEQMAELRSDLDKKQAELKSAQASVRHQELEAKHLQAEMLELRQIQRANMEKIAELTMERDIKEKASSETQALRDAVEKEAERLVEIKRTFLTTIKANTPGQTPLSGVDSTASSAGNQKVAFLETNLQQITTAHKQLIQSHNELQREFSKLDARVKAKSERINLLETAIANIKQDYRDKKRQLTVELDQIKKTYEARMKRGGVHRSTIVKAVRPGHAVSTASTPVGIKPGQAMQQQHHQQQQQSQAAAAAAQKGTSGAMATSASTSA
eukprot:scpid28833/ scgid5520/ Kinesin heavy chain